MKSTRLEPDQEIEMYELVLGSMAELPLVMHAFDSADTDSIAYALGLVARARGMSRVARQAGVARETLYRALREDGDPKLSTLLGAIEAHGRVSRIHRRKPKDRPLPENIRRGASSPACASQASRSRRIRLLPSIHRE